MSNKIWSVWGTFLYYLLDNENDHFFKELALLYVQSKNLFEESVNLFE